MTDAANAPQLNFVCVGPQRTATSWLHKHLRSHPQLVFPRNVKETMFFDEHYERGLAWYWRHFAEVTDGQLRGEIAPTYFDSPAATERLRQFAGLHVIINVRNPVERTYSVFRHHRVKGRVPDDFFEAVKLMPRIETSGRYAEYCGRWEAAFGECNCHYVLQSEVEASPQQVIDDLCRFLSVAPLTLSADASQRFGQTTRPRWQFAAKAAAKVSSTLRAHGLHGPIEAAKRLGMRPLFFGKPAGEEPIPEKVRLHLEQVHADDLAYLQHRFSRPVL